VSVGTRLKHLAIDQRLATSHSSGVVVAGREGALAPLWAVELASNAGLVSSSASGRRAVLNRGEIDAEERRFV